MVLTLLIEPDKVDDNLGAILQEFTELYVLLNPHPQPPGKVELDDSGVLKVSINGRVTSEFLKYVPDCFKKIITATRTVFICKLWYTLEDFSTLKHLEDFLDKKM